MLDSGLSLKDDIAAAKLDLPAHSGALSRDLWQSISEHPLIAIAAVAGALVSARTLAFKLSAKPALANLATVVAYVESCNSKGILSQGTAFFLKTDGTMATALHVVQDSREINIWTSLNQHHSATLLAKDAKNDLAILRVGQPCSGPLSSPNLSSSFFAFPGRRVFTLGHPAGSEEIVRTEGKFMLERPMPTLLAKNMDHAEWAGSPRMLFEMESGPGYSGAPVFDRRGRIWGMLTDGSQRGVSSAVPVSKIRDLQKTIGQT